MDNKPEPYPENWKSSLRQEIEAPSRILSFISVLHHSELFNKARVSLGCRKCQDYKDYQVNGLAIYKFLEKHRDCPSKTTLQMVVVNG